MNSTRTPAVTAEGVLRDPDRQVKRDRELRLVWDLAPDPEGGTRQAVLALNHQKNGRGQASFVGTMLNQTQQGHTERMGSILDWTTITVQPAARYSEHNLTAFSTLALCALRVKVAAGVAAGEAAGIDRYFAVQS